MVSIENFASNFGPFSDRFMDVVRTKSADGTLEYKQEEALHSLSFYDNANHLFLNVSVVDKRSLSIFLKEERVCVFTDNAVEWRRYVEHMVRSVGTDPIAVRYGISDASTYMEEVASIFNEDATFPLL